MPFQFLSSRVDFPDPSTATDDGLVAVGGDLRPERLIKAYSLGIFPWYSEGQPILWFSPDPRMILSPAKFKRSQSLNRVILSKRYEIRVDTAFSEVIHACASTPRPGQEGTWITSEMIAAYIEMHRLGYAHSFETFDQGELVGGLYGLSLGGAFFGESMFHHRPDASKFALWHLSVFAQARQYDFIDAQTPSKHLASLGAETVERRRFLAALSNTLKKKSLIGPWSI